MNAPVPKPWVMAIAPYIPGRATTDSGKKAAKLSSNENPFGTPDAARAAFTGKPGIQVVDNPAEKLFPVPLDTTGKDDCLVGRIRQNLVLENALDLWVVGDQVRKGAALNAVQIAELL